MHLRYPPGSCSLAPFETLELIEEHSLGELLTFLVQDFDGARAQEEETVGDRLHPTAQSVGKAGAEVHHSLRKFPIDVSKVYDHELLALETIRQILDLFKAPGTLDAHPSRRAEKVTEGRPEGRGGLVVVLRVPEPRRQTPER